MENKINIAEILRDMPKGTKLYSPLFGKCELAGVDNSKYPIAIKAQRTDGTVFKGLMKDGRYFDGYEDAECSLFPSAKMRDWSKFFKRGDILVYSDLEKVVVFDGWAKGDYTKFKTTINHYKISDGWDKGSICLTSLYTKANDEEKAKFIAAAEKHYGGKYNPETLQVEPAKHGCPFKPFQKVLVRDCGEDNWCPSFFSHYERWREFPYVTIAGAFRQCLFYEGYEDLLGTTDAPF